MKLQLNQPSSLAFHGMQNKIKIIEERKKLGPPKGS